LIQVFTHSHDEINQTVTMLEEGLAVCTRGAQNDLTLFCKGQPFPIGMPSSCISGT